MDKNQMISAYWLITDTTQEQEANMKELTIEKSGFAFKCLTNYKGIEPYTPLHTFTPATTKPRPLAGAVVVDDENQVKRRRTGKDL